MSTARSTADFALRLAFFAAAPFAIVRIATLFPVGAAVVQIVLALGVFFAGEAAHALAARSGLARRLLRNQLAFEAYYRAHPPGPFLYYVFYPLLFPYWLWNTEARREFLLFKGYTLFSFTLLVASLGVQYWRSFPPELGARDFVPIAAGTLAVETVVILAFLMPMVTTVVHLHREAAPRRLALLLVVAIVSVGFAGYRVTRKRDPLVSFASRERARLRTARDPRRAREVQAEALRAAWAAIQRTRGDVDTDGKVEGAPLEAGRAALEAFYKPDETAAWDLWYRVGSKGARRDKREKVLVVYFAAGWRRRAMWLSLDGAGAVSNDPNRLPSGAFDAMRKAAVR
ncbi:MAG: hypothetical protein IPF92_28500 [Myxococcales bacterium]|jgi:hypothetical protein|nr:hypothetical protein [Myxococcales bacterium]MBL0196444.1 hypothetical protein [Myxococcales bacterium]HQY63502.1 hypothetical protein [Polyangiaceae bacterium]